MEEACPRRAVPPWLVALALIGVVGWLLFALRSVLTPIFFAFLIAYMLDPIVDRLETLRLPRGAAITVLLTVVLGAFAVLLLLVVPGVLRDVASVLGELPEAAQRLRRQWEPVLTSYGVPVPHSLSEALEQLSSDTQELARQAVAPAAAVIRGIVGGTANAVAAAVGLLVVPVFSFYLLYDFDRMIAAMGELVPPRYRPATFTIAREVDEVVGQWVRGQVLVMVCLSVLYAVGYSVVGVRLAIPIALVAGLLSFIPYLGGGLALGLALLMCAFDFQGWGQVLGVVGVYAAVQVLEGFVITPKVVGEKVGLSAVWVLFALMVAGEIFGFLGVLLAVPGAAVCKIFIVRAVDAYRRSDLFRGEASRAADDASAPEALAAQVLEAGGPATAGDDTPSAGAPLARETADDEAADGGPEPADETSAEPTDGRSAGLSDDEPAPAASEPAGASRDGTGAGPTAAASGAADTTAPDDDGAAEAAKTAPVEAAETAPVEAAEAAPADDDETER